MGCDIHFYVERWTTEPDTSNGPKDITEYREERVNTILDEQAAPVAPRWVSQDNWKKISEPGERDYWQHTGLYRGRNYWLFNFLADVRYGAEGVAPLSKPRGVPEDASYSYKMISGEWDSDAHSHSYFTLTELLAVPESVWEKIEARNFKETLDKMSQLDTDTDNVRCVFFFDN